MARLSVCPQQGAQNRTRAGLEMILFREVQAAPGKAHQGGEQLLFGVIFNNPFGAYRRRTPRAMKDPRAASERSRQGVSLGTRRSAQGLGGRRWHAPRRYKKKLGGGHFAHRRLCA